MTAYKATYIECDQCGAFSMPRKPRRAALALAAERGWDIGRGRIADLCPRCATPAAVPETRGKETR